MENFNKLTPAETERLAILAEECGDVIRIIGKILRHGGPTNRDLLEAEIGDIEAVSALVQQAYDAHPSKVHDLMLHKMVEITQDKLSIHHQ